MNKHLILLDVVGLSASLLGQSTPNLNKLVETGFLHNLKGVFPAVTTTAQSSMLTGLYPNEHGIVGNGWYDRDFAEVLFWKQSNRLVRGEKIWELLKKQRSEFSCSKLFWWYNMYADVDASITPRPHYPADGRKIIDLYSTPTGLHQQLEQKLGRFPFFNFWGPKAGIESSRWIAQAAMEEFKLHRPSLQLVYLPHLDYCLQKFGPQDSRVSDELRDLDQLVADLIDFYRQQNAEVLIVSEYGIESVDTVVAVNQILRRNGYLSVRDSLSWELLDPGASRAFAVADHQVAHIYLKDPRDSSKVKSLLSNTAGIEYALDRQEQKQWHIDHPRAGDIVAVAEKGAWFSYYYWLEDNKAPDFARTVDIHRKPGYDPVEMFLDPDIRLPHLKVAWRLLQKQLGQRMLMDVIPLQPGMVGGSHGRLTSGCEPGPLIMGTGNTLKAEVQKLLDGNSMDMRDVFTVTQRFFQ